MKRPSSPSSDLGSETKPYIDELSDNTSPAPPKSKKNKTQKTPSKSRKSSAPSSPSKAKVEFDAAREKMEWDADGKEALMDYLIAQGLKGIDKAVLAEKFGFTKQKIHNELSLGRNGNMRSKATKAVGE